jgi:hypothetical protein
MTTTKKPIGVNEAQEIARAMMVADKAIESVEVEFMSEVRRGMMAITFHRDGRFSNVRVL